MNFKVIGKITEIETIATGNAIKELYEKGRWRQLNKEAEKRVKEYDEGKVNGLDGEKVFQELRDHLERYSQPDTFEIC